MYDLKVMYNDIINDVEDTQISINVKDLIWTIMVYEHQLHLTEQELYDAMYGKIFGDIRSLITQKECYASRSDELARLLSEYSDFDTQKIWEQTKKIHALTNTYGL